MYKLSLIEVQCIFLPAPQVCHEYLVSGKNSVPDNQLTASSTFSNFSSGEYGPERARLFAPTVANTTYKNGGWSPQISDRNQYIQVSTNMEAIIIYILVQSMYKPFDLYEEF